MAGFIRGLFYSLRFYSIGREQYSECMNKVFSNNLLNLRQANIIVAIFVSLFSLFPILVEKNILKMFVYLAVAAIAIIIAVICNYNLQKINVSEKFIYALITLFYANIMLFGIYLSVWSNPDTLASIFYMLLICALLLFVMSPIYNFILTFIILAVFIASAVIVNEYEVFIFNVVNAVIAGMISLYFTWQITKLKLSLEYSTGKLEEERSKYLNQSAIDELTQLRNRRDYMQTFQRFVHNFRASDDWFCVAISDIDFFKNYNDHYGHPKGDDCLRAVGGVLNNLRETIGVYTARVGGEEFSMLWFEKDVSNVDSVIKKVTDLIKDLKIPHEKSKVSEYVTMSIGVYVVRCSASNDVQTLYDAADKALYMAKAGGRNCAVVCGEEIKNYKITPSDSE
jgi:diguanylate cyclase (GGDEF)-like protein